MNSYYVSVSHTVRKMLLWVLLSVFVLPALAANTVETVVQVSGNVTLSDNVDYVITSETPFADGATIDITNTENAVVIFSKLKPTLAIKQLSNITINGVRASNSTNCQVRIYADGAILLPYPESEAPLTVYTGDDLTGDSEQFAVGNRVTLLNKPMNNAIRSFTLRRGYMVCMATKYDGKGYSRVFIADKENISVNLPNILTSAVSSIRVSKWNDASKKGYAGNDVAANTALNTTWCYNWDAGVNIWDDREYVTQHHHEGWPGISDVGNNGTSACILGNNEPDNVADDREQVNSVDDVLKTWPDMMATGKRLGSPAMSSNMTWLYSFIDSIDKRGWRCDFVVMHCYWYSDWSSWYSTLKAVHDRTKRPIWITEMNYGANWTGWPGSDRTGSATNYAIELQHMGPVVDGLESTPWLERYAVYNWVEDCRMVYTNGTLTPFGEYYASKPSAIAYDSRYEYVPALPKMYPPSDLAVIYDKSTQTSRLTWKEYNGEYNGSMTVERKRTSSGNWETVASIPLQEEAGEYTFDDTDATNGSYYRIHVVDAAGTSHYTREQMASASDFEAGDVVTTQSGETRYLGGNAFVNGDFDLGNTSWLNGEGQPIGQPYFEVMQGGSIDGGSYLQAFSDMAADKAGAVKAVVDVVPESDYYFSMAICADGLAYNRLSLSSDGESEDNVVATGSISPTWSNQSFQFNSAGYDKALLSLRRLAAMSQIDKIMLCRLYENRADAIADGIEKMRLRAAAVCEYLADSDKALSDELKDLTAGISGTDDEAYLTLRSAVERALQASRDHRVIDSLLVVAESIRPLAMPGHEALEEAVATATSCATASDYIDAVQLLSDALAVCLPMTEADASLIKSPSFESSKSTGWTVKSGTYTGGEQTATTVGGKSCWKAQWTGIDAAEGSDKTMAIRQEVSGLPHGLYVLECKAATQHYCLTDQRAYLVTPTDSVVSPVLSTDLLDITNATEDNIWQMLTTTPVYIGDDDVVTIGFTGSKEGAIDNAWRELGNKSSVGDKREGSWCATDFRFRYLPLYRASVDESLWGVICLPQAITPAEGVTLYKIAGINPAATELCIEPVSETVAGMPYIYQAADTVPMFFQSGESVTRALTDDSNLRGNFVTYSKALAGSFVLENGEWNIVLADARPLMKSYSGILLNTDKLAELDSWTGLTMKINGATSGIHAVEAGSQSGDARFYTTDGRKVDVAPSSRGVYIEVKGNSVRKVMK